MSINRFIAFVFFIFFCVISWLGYAWISSFNAPNLSYLIDYISGRDIPVRIINSNSYRELGFNNQKSFSELLKDRRILDIGIIHNGKPVKINQIVIELDDVDHINLGIMSNITVNPAIKISSAAYEVINDKLKMNVQLAKDAIESGKITDEEFVKIVNQQVIELIVAMTKNFNTTEGVLEVNKNLDLNEINVYRLFNLYNSKSDSMIFHLKRK